MWYAIRYTRVYLAFSSYERTEILNSFKYFTGLSSLAEKNIVQPMLTRELAAD